MKNKSSYSTSQFTWIPFYQELAVESVDLSAEWQEIENRLIEVVYAKN